MQAPVMVLSKSFSDINLKNFQCLNSIWNILLLSFLLFRNNIFNFKLFTNIILFLSDANTKRETGKTAQIGNIQAAKVCLYAL
jgi:hypothetical protein